jgi:polysaccharide biosynthesis/export protein
MRLCVLLAGLIVLGSCVPNRRLVYLQHDDLKDRNSIPKDSVLRRHTLQIKEYRIQPLDNLSITFESLTAEEFDFFSRVTPQLRGGGSAGATAAVSGILVDGNGEIEYPVIGKIKLSGLTVFEAQKKLQDLASQYLRDVVVRIRLLNFRFTILGEVRGESTLVSANTRLTIMEAIGLSGGLTELADRSLVKVIRQVGSESEIFYVNLLEEDYIESQFYFVQQNDIIIVPPLRQRTFKTYFSTNLGLITSTVTAIIFLISVSNLRP